MTTIVFLSVVLLACAYGVNDNSEAVAALCGSWSLSSGPGCEPVSVPPSSKAT